MTCVKVLFSKYKNTIRSPELTITKLLEHKVIHCENQYFSYHMTLGQLTMISAPDFYLHAKISFTGIFLIKHIIVICLKPRNSQWISWPSLVSPSGTELRGVQACPSTPLLLTCQASWQLLGLNTDVCPIYTEFWFLIIEPQPQGLDRVYYLTALSLH